MVGGQVCDACESKNKMYVQASRPAILGVAVVAVAGVLCGMLRCCVSGLGEATERDAGGARRCVAMHMHVCIVSADATGGLAVCALRGVLP